MSIETDFVALGAIARDGGTQSRAKIDGLTVAEYADAIREGSAFPPVTVFFDGTAYWLADGFHRVAAHEEAGKDRVQAEIHQGDKRAAILHSVGANASHGLRRTNADKRRAVETMLRDDEWASWPQTKIAKHCGVSREYVSRLSVKSSSCDRSQDAKREVVRGGKTYTMNTENIGGKKPADAPKKAGAENTDGGAPESSKPAEIVIEEAGVEPAKAQRPPSPYANLTREALEHDLLAVTEENAALKASIEKKDGEIERLEGLNKLLSSEGSGATISQLERRRITAVGKMKDYQAAAKREEFKRKRAEQERDEAIRKLEDQVIPL